MHEAILSAVPMIGLPFFGDQLYNAALMVNKGIGEFVPIESTNDPQVLIEALHKVLNQPKYRNNIKLLQKKLQMSPFTPEEKFVKWVEFAAEFPNLNELNLPFDELGFLAYYCLDVIFVVIILMLCIFIFVIYVFKWSVSPLFSKHFVRKMKTA
uniref:glucuronosyltransferase n=1 Tax=Ditylenchus dipsaci TaxID=166011 RepID=A0A915EUB7_9BILA